MAQEILDDDITEGALARAITTKDELALTYVLHVCEDMGIHPYVRRFRVRALADKFVNDGTFELKMLLQY